MKQQITETQYNEISEAKKMVWRKFMVKAGNAPSINHLPSFPAIGQMIEFLDEKVIFWLKRQKNNVGDNNWYIEFSDYEKSYKPITYIELCDALWKAVKEELNETS